VSPALAGSGTAAVNTSGGACANALTLATATTAVNTAD
jgi:hypothetical protein